MKKRVLEIALFILVVGVSLSLASVYNFGNTDVVPLLHYVFDITSGHHHDGVNSRLITTVTTLGVGTTSTIGKLEIKGSSTAPSQGVYLNNAWLFQKNLLGTTTVQYYLGTTTGVVGSTVPLYGVVVENPS